jgi:regulator of sigma E protease
VLIHALADPLRTIVAFAVVLGVLIFVHELGHYLAARWVGVHVEVFSIGFGRAIASWTDRRGTVWKLAWLPLGGYVRMHGMTREDDLTPERQATRQRGRAFADKSVGARAVVIAAGPLANFVLAALVFTVLNVAVGHSVSTSTIGQVVPDSAAAAAGLQTGDTIVAIDGAKITDFDDVKRIVSAHPAQPITINLTREGAPLEVRATPGSQVADGKTVGMLGIVNRTEFKPVGVVDGLYYGVTQTWSVSRDTMVGVWQMITGRRGANELGGVIRIAQLSGQVAQLGLASLLSFIAVLSINLGLINLFPVPVLDGGHLVFYAAEAVRGRPIPTRAQEYSYRAGFAVIMSLVVFSAWNDLAQLGVVRWVVGLIG